MIRTPNLILIGFMGTGKSSIGRKCASLLGFPHHDTDAWIVRKAQKPIPQVFEEEGEDAFRTLEREAVQVLSRRSAVVLSTGGGVVLNPENVRHLRESGVVVLLTARPEVILSRVGRNPNRPLLVCDDPLKRVGDLLLERDGAYRIAAHAVVDTSNQTRDAAAHEVVSIYRKLAAC